VSHEDGTLVAYNTDTFALAHEIQNLAPELRGRWAGVTALVLGTGGAARSAIVALGVELGAGRVVVRGRSLGDMAKRAAFEEEMGTLVTEAGGAATIVGEPWHAHGPHDAEVSVVVQSTSAGMKGADPGEAVNAAVDWSALSPRAIALDVVYAPPETPFLKSAHEHGLRATNGIGMLARQGALAFELWLGVPAPYNAMLTALV
jgi:shikimate dehydrogenase